MNKLLDRKSLCDILQGFGLSIKAWNVGLLLIGAIAALGLLVDFHNTSKFGQIDLRNRVVGARVMMLTHNPYTHSWQPGEPTTLLDPYMGTNKSISAVTVTPAVLSIHALLADFPYRYQKFIWLFAQWALFGGMVWLAMLRAETPETQAAVFLLGLMFSCSTFWRMHVERGQVYVLFSFLAVLYATSFKWRMAYRDVLGGFVLGVLVCLRPHMAMLGVPLILYRKWAGILGAVLGLFVGLASPTLISRSAWPDYAHAMLNYIQPPPAPPAAEPPPLLPPDFPIPAVVEDSTNLTTFAKFGAMDTTLKGAVAFHLHRPTSTNLLLVILAAGTIAWFSHAYRSMIRMVPIDYCTVKMLGLILFFETFLPITRGEYSNLIMLSIILLIFSIRSQPGAMRSWEWALLIAAWIFSAPFPPWMSSGFRGVGIGMISHCAVLLWVAFAPWREAAASSPVALGSLRELQPANK